MRLEHVNITVPDPDGSAAVLCQLFGWHVRWSGEAKDNGYETVVLLDHHGNVTEGPGFNAFAVKGDRVVTSDHGVLHGITRRTVLEMCAEAGLETTRRVLRNIPTHPGLNLIAARCQARIGEEQAALRHLGLYLEVMNQADADHPQVAEARELAAILLPAK